MTAQLGIGSKKQVVLLHYQGTLPNANGTFSQLYPTAFPGSVIGAALYLNGTLATGTVQAAPTINGNVCPVPTPPLHSSAQVSFRHQDAQRQGCIFRSGDVLGAMWQTSGTGFTNWPLCRARCVRLAGVSGILMRVSP
ncbi:MAG: hypothetical protein KatS3mg038_1013 [Candidatus Kapaibacterium sp.]|nr:MAG: hypothetical protein KatS3mg038_1013 [Candidatus Kapabacteria bacterium]